MLLNIVIAWLVLDVVAILMVLYDYRHWYCQANGRLQKDNRTPGPLTDSTPTIAA
jgi:hypothetical protein